MKETQKGAVYKLKQLGLKVNLTSNKTEMKDSRRKATLGGRDRCVWRQQWDTRRGAVKSTDFAVCMKISKWGPRPLALCTRSRGTLGSLFKSKKTTAVIESLVDSQESTVLNQNWTEWTDWADYGSRTSTSASSKLQSSGQVASYF